MARDLGSELFSGLAGVGKGAATTCVGDQMLGMAMGFTQLAMKATGLNSPQSATQQVPVKLADTQCPDWLRLGGSCSIIVSVKEGYMLGATMVPTSHAELLPKIAKQLTTKYGKPSEKSALTSCINNLTGMVTDQAPELRWKLPGLYVTYTPLVSDCKRGRIVVELATLHQMATEQQAAHEAAEPSM